MRESHLESSLHRHGLQRQAGDVDTGVFGSASVGGQGEYDYGVM